MKEPGNIYQLLKRKINYDSASEMGWVFSGQSINVLLGFLIIKLISRIGPGQYGVYALILTLAAVLGLFYGAFLQGFLRYYYHYEALKRRNAIIKLMFAFIKLTLLVFIILSILVSFLFPLFDSTYTAAFYLGAGLFVIASKLSEFFNSILNLIRKRKENALLQALERALMIAALLLFIFEQNLTLIYILFAFSCISFIMAFTKIFLFRKYIPASDEEEAKGNQKDIIKTVMVYISPFLIWALAGWFQLNGEKWIINGVLSVSDVGIYAVMMAIVNALVVIPNNIVTEFATPIIFKQFADMNNRKNIIIGYTYIKINMAFILLVTILSTVITFLWGKTIINLISSENYTLYWYILPALVMGTGLFYTGQALTLLGLGMNQPQKYITPKIAIGMGSLGINYLFVSKAGIEGIAYSIMLIGLLYVLYIAVVNKRILKDW
jgi:O-antigen/teichoic acid export membrane protein